MDFLRPGNEAILIAKRGPKGSHMRLRELRGVRRGGITAVKGFHMHNIFLEGPWDFLSCSFTPSSEAYSRIISSMYVFLFPLLVKETSCSLLLGFSFSL